MKMEKLRNHQSSHLLPTSTHALELLIYRSGVRCADMKTIALPYGSHAYAHWSQISF